ncbi:helix-turn-helix domain-containing protein [Microbacteriaceae bacterium VKM Ac-2855]|nr:helix-turn-helix domain-containing protein [Microbacteriaceae bacterium VKM Ac-2855]
MPDTSGFSPEPLQRIVERLANTLHRSVAVDDAELRLLANSAHFGDEDPARIHSLVGRSQTPERMEWSRVHGVLRATAPINTPGEPALGIRPRYVVPVRLDRELLAIIWIIDDGTLTPDEIAAIDRAADDVRVVVLQRAHRYEEDVRRLQQRLAGLVSGDTAERAAAASELSSFRDCSAFQVVLLRTETETAPPLRVIERAIAPRSSALAVARIGGEMMLLIGYASVPASEQQDAMVDALLRALDAETAGVVVGVGGVVDDLELAYASRDQADRALRIARARDERTVRWEQSTLDGLLAAALPEHLPAHLLPPALADAIESQSEENLLAVRGYLANAGNVVKTSTELHLHRTTVYYRLSRFTEGTGLDLEDGDTRLLLHLWFALRPYTILVP